MDQVSELNERLAAYFDALNEGGVNYGALVGLVEVERAPNDGAREILLRAVDGGVPGIVTACDAQAVIAAVSDGFQFVGGSGAYPSPDFAGSGLALMMLNRIECDLLELLDGADLIGTITLDPEHALYAVFWGYLFVFAKGNRGYVLLGSCSD